MPDYFWCGVRRTGAWFQKGPESEWDVRTEEDELSNNKLEKLK